MPCKPSLILLAAFAVAPLPIGGSAWATSSDDVPAPMLKNSIPERAPAWGHPTEAVRSAFGALHDACAAWPKEPSLASGPSALMPAELVQPYVTSCQLSLDPQGFRLVSLLEGGLLGGAAAGIAALMFIVAKILLNRLVDMVARRADGWLD